MILTIASIVVNVIFILLFILFLIKPELFNSQIDAQFKARYSALQKHYQDEENRLQKELAAKTRQVADEIFALRRKLESDIKQELEASKNYQYQEIESEVKYRINLLREREQVMEEQIMARFEAFKIQYDEQEALISQKLESLKSYETAAIEARIRMYEEKYKEKFYTIQIEDDAVEEVQELVDILPKLKNPVPLRKAIFDIYYRQPVKDLVYRIIGDRQRPSGIYKITLIETGECYVGQSVDVGNR